MTAAGGEVTEQGVAVVAVTPHTDTVRTALDMLRPLSLRHGVTMVGVTTGNERISKWWEGRGGEGGGFVRTSELWWWWGALGPVSCSGGGGSLRTSELWWWGEP